MRRLMLGFLAGLAFVSLGGQAFARESARAAAQDSAATLPDEALPRGAHLYVAPMANGFDTYVIAGLQDKQVPIVVVTSPEKADFEMSGVSESDKAGWAKTLFTGSTSTAETASVKIVNLQTGRVVYAYSYNTGNSVRGRQSAGESVAKHIKDKIEKSQQKGSVEGTDPNLIAAGSRVYVSTMEDGFEDYLKAAIAGKKVPLEVVSDRATADYEIAGHSESQKAGAAKILIGGSFHSAEEASITMSDVHTGVVVYAYSVNKENSAHGKQSTAEAIAKHLKDRIETKR